MIVAFIVYIAVYLIGTFILTIPHDSKLTTYKSRVQFSGICMIVWPIFIPLGITYAFHDFDKEMITWEKEKNLRWRLESIDPSIVESWTHDQRKMKKGIKQYLNDHDLLDGIGLIKDKSVNVEKFMQWLNVNIPDPTPTPSKPKCITREEFENGIRMHVNGCQNLSRTEIENILKFPTITHPKTSNWPTDNGEQF